MELRPYQREALDTVTAYLAERDDNPVICLPTGAGKTIVFATMIREYLEYWPGTRILILAHVRELLAQAADKLTRVWPMAPIGIYSAGLNRRDTAHDILIAGIQSVFRRAFELGHFDLIVVDEAHRIPVNGEGMYRQFLKDAKTANPHVRVIGFTATPFRLGAGLIAAPEYILNSICYDADVATLIREGYLCALTSKGGTAKADISGVHIRNGEFVQDELEAAINRDDLIERAMDEILRYGRDRKSWILFCVSVAHAENVSTALGRRGVAAPVVHGETPAEERASLIGRFDRGELRALVNVNVLSEGFDSTRIDMIVLLRPTASPGLYMQQVGRGLRLHPGKANTLVLDLAGNIERHGPIDAIKAKRHRAGDKIDKAVTTAPVKECPRCHEMVLAMVRTCTVCGYEWPVAPVHAAVASDKPILSEIRVDTYDVQDVLYGLHEREGKTTSLRVDYYCGIRQFSEWVCLAHEGYPRRKAVIWWANRAPGQTVPASAYAAMSWLETNELREPKRILVNTGGKYPEIINHVFEEPNEHAGTDGTGARSQSGARATPGEIVHDLFASR
ncbi:MAG: DEAD/DEAH box helicase family protein [Burkholderiales bacterium]|nr:DEAD/DEAH box helicase family protein [Burkholderiales bacterium]